MSSRHRPAAMGKEVPAPPNRSGSDKHANGVTDASSEASCGAEGWHHNRTARIRNRRAGQKRAVTPHSRRRAQILAFEASSRSVGIHSLLVFLAGTQSLALTVAESFETRYFAVTGCSIPSSHPFRMVQAN